MLPAGLAAGAPGAANADDRDAREWLLRMVEAEATLNFHGDFVFSQGDTLEMMHITHLVDGERRLQRLAAMSGPQREIFRDGDRVVCFFPGERRAVVMRGGEPHGFLGLNRQDVEALQEYYSFEAAPGDRVAGRETKRLRIEPRDDNRFSYQLWLDRKTGLLLRSELHHPDGELRQRMVFTSLRMVPGGTLEHWLPDQEEGAFTWVYEDYQAEPDPKRTLHWKPEWLPAGFELKVERSRGPGPDELLLEHLVYGDGLNTISVFVEPEATVDLPEGAVTVGAAEAYSVRAGERRVTVLGEVAAGTLKRVAESIEGVDP